MRKKKTSRVLGVFQNLPRAEKLGFSPKTVPMNKALKALYVASKKSDVNRRIFPSFFAKSASAYRVSISQGKRTQKEQVKVALFGIVVCPFVAIGRKRWASDKMDDYPHCGDESDLLRRRRCVSAHKLPREPSPTSTTRFSRKNLGNSWGNGAKCIVG